MAPRTLLCTLFVLINVHQETNRAERAKTFDAGLMELLKEHCGASDKSKPKRGKKVVPYSDL